MYIKIYNKSQLILLEQINPLLGKYRLPLELLTEVEKILACEKIGKKGFIAILLNPVKGDIQEISCMYELTFYSAIEVLVSIWSHCFD